MAIINFTSEEQINKYINGKIQKLNTEHQQEVKRTYYLKKEYSKEDYNKMIDQIYYNIQHIPDEILKSKDEFISSDMIKEQYISNCKNEIELIESDMKKAEDFQKFLVEERKKLEKYPRCNQNVIDNLTEYINQTVNYYHQDLIDEYFDLFVQKVKNICPKDKDYSKTIESVYLNKNGKRAMQILDKFSQKLINALITITLTIKNNKTSEFMMIETVFKNKFYRLIDIMYLFISNFIKKQINSIPEAHEMSNSKLVKSYAESLMFRLNESLTENLPELLNEEFMERVNYLKEDLTANKSFTGMLKYDKVEKSTDPLVEEVDEDAVIVIQDSKPTFENFLKTLPDDEIEVSELCSMFNNYFNTNVSTRSFSMMNNTKKYFDKRYIIRKGKKTSLYTKKQ